MVMPASLQDYRKVSGVTTEFDIDQFNDYSKKLLSLCNVLHEIKLTVILSVSPFWFSAQYKSLIIYSIERYTAKERLHHS